MICPAFPWRFIVAGMCQPITGGDFLAHYNLLPEMKRRKLIDRKTGLEVKGAASVAEIASVKTVLTQSEYHEILTRYPALT